MSLPEPNLVRPTARWLVHSSSVLFMCLLRGGTVRDAQLKNVRKQTIGCSF
jgi:hypothetical protein